MKSGNYRITRDSIAAAHRLVRPHCADAAQAALYIPVWHRQLP
jgi:hypothetical protein